ncbi:hypothetical protein GCM10010495_74050 [Kitasatospora herbaricolor]|uniref:hypothetical protein n=1 Tax=Kitasatospora herbaricolor TaxID=68217 RepID=UPI0017482D54|nr:hypothetical protein [Kitasatospora herbaricolor]MDQ0305459.1 hypothetical protein [Kitasatospora herbaricolor]GGV45659.1 hypothetical protein GCM10010495_74050 [Kitasatospora herbaricolor]
MAGRAAEHVARLRAALAVLGVDWRPDAVADDDTRAVMLATALLGAAEAHLVGAELEAEQAGADIEALRSAYGPVRDEVVAAAVPDPENLDRLLLVLRTSLLLDDLGRAAGPDEQHPDIEALAAARDAVAAASALLACHFAPTLDPGSGRPDPQESLMLAFGLFAQGAGRLTRIAEEGPQGGN